MSLTGRPVKDSYKDLIIIPNSNAGIDGTMRTVTDGEGTASTLQLSTSGMHNTGNTVLGGSTGQAGFAHTIHGDLYIGDAAAEAVLTVEHTGGEATDAAVLRLKANTPAVIFEDLDGAADKKLFNIGMGSGSLNLTAYDDSDTALQTNLALQSDGNNVYGPGAAEAGFKHTFHGDLYIGDAAAEAVLTVENTGTGPAVLRLKANAPTLAFEDLDGAADQRLFNIGMAGAALNFTAYSDSAVPQTGFQLTTSGGSVLGVGAADPGYQHTIHGDVIIKETDAGQEALLTLDSSGSDVEDLASLSLYGTSAAVVFQDTNGTTGKQRQHIGLDHGSLNFAIYSDDGLTLHGVPLKIAPGADPATQRNVIMEDLPTTDPSVTGALWNRGGQLMVSGSTRHIYDSGWVTQWGSTTLAANVMDAVVLPSYVDDYFPFQMNIWGRLAASPDTVYPIDITAQSQNTSGVQVAYNASTRALTLYFQDNAGEWEVTPGGGSVAAWGGTIDEIRVTIRK